MKTFCMSFNADINGEVRITADRAHYIKNVIRLVKEDKLVLFNTKDKQKYIVEIMDFPDSEVIVKIREKYTDSSDLAAEIFLAFALLKGSNNDLLIKKAVEVGVKGFIPFISERTVSVIKKGSGKQKRWEKLVVSAVEQSKAACIPFIYDVCDFDSLIDTAAQYDTVLIGDASLESVNLSDIDFGDKKQVLVIIGPEGGFSKTEMDKLKTCGKCFSFGENVLRAETAGIVLPALVLSEIKRQKSES